VWIRKAGVSDHTLPLSLTLILGKGGYGKSTFAYRYLLNAPASCRFLFDDLGRASAKLGLPAVGLVAELEAALSTHWVCFNPHRMFPGKTKEAFRWFCKWVYEVSKRGPGKKLFLVDEIWQWQDRGEIPPELSLVVRTGREENIELVCATQTPGELDYAITGQSTEVVCFRLDEKRELDWVGRLGGDPDAVRALQRFQWIAWNRESGVRLNSWG
jgi:hypothetical protein